MTIGHIRPDDDTMLGLLMTAVKRVADAQSRTASDVAQIKVTLETFPRLIADSAAENRRYYQGLQARLDDELGTDYDDISGSHDVKSLRDAGRSWRKRARDEETAKIKASAAAEAADLERKEAKAAALRWKRLTAAVTSLAVAVVALVELLRGLAH